MCALWASKSAFVNAILLVWFGFVMLPYAFIFKSMSSRLLELNFGFA